MATTRCTQHFLAHVTFTSPCTHANRPTAQHSSTVHGVQMPFSFEAWECTLSSLGSAAEIMVCFVGRAPASSSCSVSSFSQASWEVGEKSCQLHWWRCVQTKHFAQWSKTKCMIVPELRVRKADVLSRGESWGLPGVCRPGRLSPAGDTSVICFGITSNSAPRWEPTTAGQVPVGRFSVNIQMVFVSPEVD